MVILDEDFSLDDALDCICGFSGNAVEMFEHYIVKHPNLLIQLILEDE